MHRRSPAAFHEIVTNQILGQKTARPFRMVYDLKNNSFFESYYTMELLQRGVETQDILMVSSELLAEDPNKVWKEILKFIPHISPSSDDSILPGIKLLINQRINSNDNKGTMAKSNITNYKPGLYSISHFQPMYESTREILDKTWYSDCLWTSSITGIRLKMIYSVCVNLCFVFEG